MRTKEIISKIKIKLKSLGYQNNRDYFSDEEILAFVNDAQNDIIINHYPLQGKYVINITNPNAKEYNLPNYIGKIILVKDNLDNIYRYLTPKQFETQALLYSYTLLNNLLLFKSALPNGAGSIIIYFHYIKAPENADLNSKDLIIPTIYDKAIEYYALSQLLIGEQSVYFLNLYRQELIDKAGIQHNLTETPRIIEGTW